MAARRTTRGPVQVQLTAPRIDGRRDCPHLARIHRAQGDARISVVSVLPLLAGSGSVVPVGGVTVAVLLSVPSAAGSTVRSP